MQKLYIENRDGEVFPEADRTCHYVYAHGQLQEKAGYDIVGYAKSDRFDFRNDRTEDVIAIMSDGEQIESKLFFWHSEPYDEIAKAYMRKDPVYLCHGLLVAKSDAEALEDAEKKYIERRRFI